MKNTLFAIVPSVLIVLSFACSPKIERKVGTGTTSGTEAAADVQADAADDLYVNDMVTAAGETGMDDMAMPTEGEKTTGDDMKQARLAKMAADLLEELDTDDSKSLSEAEYLSVMTNKGKELSETQKAAAAEKLKAVFAERAGTDKLLSGDELQAILKAQSSSVDKLRCKKHKGEHQNRLKANFEGMLKKFDANNDGKLNRAEFEAMRGEKKDCHRKKNGNGSAGGNGGGKGGNVGEGEGAGMDPDDVIVIPPTDTNPGTTPTPSEPMTTPTQGKTKS